MSDSASEYNAGHDLDGIALEAGGEVFLVSRCRLVQDSLVFRDMFEIARKDGASDQGGPIPTGDDAAAFRDFLWALRVRPAALLAFTKSSNTPEKAIRLVNIAALAHKYQDSSMAEWALEQLHETLSQSKFPLEGPVLSPLLIALARFHVEDKNVSALTRLLRGRVDNASPSTIDLIALIEACTTSGFTALLATAYNALLIAPGLRSLQWTNDPRLSTTNKKQLLYGAYRLTQEWDRVLCTCPSLIATAVMKCGSARSADLLAKLNAARTIADNVKANRSYYDDDTVSYFSSSAAQPEIWKWRKQVKDLIDTFPDKLATYFDLADSGL